jgi:outer membrane lipoprotein SlyB
MSNNDNFDRDVGIGIILGAIGGFVKALVEGKKPDEIAASTVGGAAAGGVTGAIKNAIDQNDKQNQAQPR